MDKTTFGEVMYRPVDKRENFVKRCVGMPGDQFEVRDNKIYINGSMTEDPEFMQLNDFVETNGAMFSEEQFRLLGISKDDRQMVSSPDQLAVLGFQPNKSGQFNPVYHFPMTKQAVEKAKKLSIVQSIIVEPDVMGGDLYYPVDYHTGWTRDNYGPVWIPKKGERIELDERNLAIYKRCIKNYENNDLEVKAGKIYINGE
jgi:signal peptidase I